MNNPNDRPLITESAVDAMREAGEARRSPAAPETRRVGALIRLVRCVTACAEACDAAAERAQETETVERITGMATSLRGFTELANQELSALGGTLGSVNASSPIPHDASVFAYVQTVGGLLERIAENLNELERVWSDLIDAGPLPDVLVAAHAVLPLAHERTR
jgi:hypothetical protein